MLIFLPLLKGVVTGLWEEDCLRQMSEDSGINFIYKAFLM